MLFPGCVCFRAEGRADAQVGWELGTCVLTGVLKIPYPEQLLDFKTPCAQWEQGKRHFDCPAFSLPFLKRDRKEERVR